MTSEEIAPRDLDDVLFDVPEAVCPGCGERQGWLAKPGETDWWCDPCLKAPITAMLDELAKTRPQRPAMCDPAATMYGTVYDHPKGQWRPFESTPSI